MNHRPAERPSPLAAAFTLLALLAVVASPPTLAATQAKPAAPAPVEGVVSRVIDGDTLVVQVEGKPPIDVRLRDIDAPEICQDYGPEAKKELERMALGKKAQLTVNGRDTYGRSIGTVVVDGQSLSKLMVSEGHAWSARTRFDRGPLMKEERMASALHRGLHASGSAVPPKDFRKTHGPCAK